MPPAMCRRWPYAEDRPVNQLGFPLLSIVLWLPTLGAVLLLLLPRENETLARNLAIGTAILTLLAALPLAILFDFSRSFQFLDSLDWVASWGLGYRVSIDGISLWLVLLVTLLTPISMAASWGSITRDLRSYQALLLLLETG